VIYEDSTIFAQYNPKDFRKLLKCYFNEYKDLDKALDMIENDLKKEVARR